MSAPPQPSVQNIRRSGRITPGNNSADRANDQPPTVSTNTKNSAPVQTLSYVAASSSFEPERASPSSSTMELKPDKDKIQNTSNSSTSAILVLCFSNKFIGILWCMFNLSLQSAIQGYGKEFPSCLIEKTIRKLWGIETLLPPLKKYSLCRSRAFRAVHCRSIIQNSSPLIQVLCHCRLLYKLILTTEHLIYSSNIQGRTPKTPMSTQQLNLSSSSVKHEMFEITLDQFFTLDIFIFIIDQVFNLHLTAIYFNAHKSFKLQAASQ